VEHAREHLRHAERERGRAAVFSPTLEASRAMSAGVTANPSALMCWVTATTSPFTLIAKYSPGAMAHAAMTAMTPTHISVIIAP
jgi:hypothetical protein